MNADIARLARDLPRAHGVLGDGARAGRCVVALQRARAANGADPRAAVERVLAERGLRPAVTALESRKGRVRLTFAAVRFDALSSVARHVGAHRGGLRAVEAVLAARVEPGTVRAELTLAG